MINTGKVEFLTENTPVKTNMPIAISTIPDNISRKLQKLPVSMCFMSPVLGLPNLLAEYYSKKLRRVNKNLEDSYRTVQCNYVHDSANIVTFSHLDKLQNSTLLPDCIKGRIVHNRPVTQRREPLKRLPSLSQSILFFIKDLAAFRSGFIKLSAVATGTGSTGTRQPG